MTLCDVREVLANVTLGIILQHVSVSNQLIHLKLSQCYVNYYSLKLGRRGGRSTEMSRQLWMFAQWFEDVRLHSSDSVGRSHTFHHRGFRGSRDPFSSLVNALRPV